MIRNNNAIIITIFLLCFYTGIGWARGNAESKDGLSLKDAIEQTAEKIVVELPKGSRVVIVAFETVNGNLSDYIMEELTGALFDRGIEVADRQNLEYVYKELKLQMSGDVSDDSAQSIGKFLGAQLVITGQLTDIGSSYRYRTNAINVETAVRASVTRFDVRKDTAMRNMVTTLANQKTTIKDAKYAYNEKATPQTAGTFLDRGILFATRGDYEMAIEDFTEAIKLDTNLVVAYMLRGRALRASISTISVVGADFSSIFGGLKGRKEATADQIRVIDLAIADFIIAIRLEPNNAVAYRERGVLYFLKGDKDQAIADYNQAIRLDPNYAYAYYNRGLAYYDKKDYDRAIADYNQAIRLDPNYAYAYSNRGLVYYVKKDYDRAIADYNQAIRLDPNYADAYYNRGLAYYDKKDYDRAIADYTQVIKLNPNDADAKKLLENARKARRR